MGGPDARVLKRPVDECIALCCSMTTIDVSDKGRIATVLHYQHHGRDSPPDGWVEEFSSAIRLHFDLGIDSSFYFSTDKGVQVAVTAIKEGAYTLNVVKCSRELHQVHGKGNFLTVGSSATLSRELSGRMLLTLSVLVDSAVDKSTSTQLWQTGLRVRRHRCCPSSAVLDLISRC